MKIRNSFVSNSSATSFILSLKDKGVNKLVECAEKNGVKSEAYGRYTALLKGQQALEWLIEMGGYGYEDLLIAGCVVIAEDGKDNLVFMNESDEAMGGYLFRKDNLRDDEWQAEAKRTRPFYNKLSKLARAEQETH